jgi:hypothetical protein
MYGQEGKEGLEAIATVVGMLTAPPQELASGAIHNNLPNREKGWPLF